MQYNEEEQKKKIKEKAHFYFQEKINAHITIIPTGFKNGKFNSDLLDNTYYWFFDFRENKQIRLFLSEIFDIEDYIEEEKINEVNKNGERK